MHKFTIPILLFIIWTPLFGQKSHLLFRNDSLEKALLFTENDYVYIEYRGYLDQLEGFRGFISQIDSMSLELETFTKNKSAKKILISDIAGIRRLHISVELGKALTVLAVSLASHYTMINYGINPYFAIFGSGSIAWGTKSILDRSFPFDRPKMRVNEGWYFQYYAF